MTKKEAKEEIRKIVAKYERLTSGEKREYNEAMTRKDFILPLFHILGWDVYNDSIPNEVKEEESAVKGTVDYSFRTNNIPQFLLEAKAIKVDLDRIEWARQAVSYGWNMGIEWVILTDFEDIKLFNASWKIDTPRPNLELNYKEYIDRFDDLWLFSKESFEKGELDKQAGKWSIGAKRVEVTEKLANDLIEWRKQLFDNFHQWNADKSEEEIDEAVQRILDRFIFMRSCEDKKIEPPILWQNFQKWSQDMKERNFLKILKPVFKEFDEKYNSNLFKEHLCDNLETEGDPFLKVISGLYGDKEAGVKYNFAAIKPDVLGKVYEQYLGHLLQKAGKRGEELGKTKRKKQGIYYTPTFIVDYIVQNALGPVLDNCKTIHDLKKIKVLDPACGSGSFLIKALEMINEKYKKFGAPGNTYTKIQILTENIYGVDLDQQAVEITRLNLLINALSEREKLPLLNNIKNGNSLLSSTDEELKKYFGKNFKDKKPLNWQEEFSEVFKQGGFDVVVGNPPYIDVRKIDAEDKKYLFNIFETAKNRTNTFSLFTEQAINLLKAGGYLGFIVPNTILIHSSYKALRGKILEECFIDSLYKLNGNIFKNAQVETTILILRKKGEHIMGKNEISIFKISEGKRVLMQTINQHIFQEQIDYRFIIQGSDASNKIILKLRNVSIDLGDIYHGYNGINPGNQKSELVLKTQKDSRYKKVIDGKNIKRYSIIWSGDWILYDKEILERARDENIFLEKPKIMLQKIGISLVAGLDTQQLYALINTTILLSKGKVYDSKYILALLNSKLINFYYKSEFLGVQIKTEFLEFLPIYKIDFSNKREKAKHDELVGLVDKILEFNKEIQKTSENSDKWDSIKSEIEKTDKKIDKLVYRLYGLTSEEIKIVEKN